MMDSSEKKKLVFISLQSGKSLISKYVLENLSEVEKHAYRERMFYFAMVSGNLECIDMVNDAFEENLWNDINSNLLYSAAVIGECIPVWHILVRCVPPSDALLAHTCGFGLERKKYASVRFAINYATENAIILPTQLKSMCLRSRNIQIMRHLHTNNPEWPPNFMHDIEFLTTRAGPRVRLELKDIRDFADSRGANKICELIRIMTDVDMPASKRQKFDRLVELF